MKVLASINAFWQHLIGEPNKFSLESRIFNSICVVVLIAIAYHIPFNFYVGLPVSAGLSIGLLLVQSYLYYLARFKDKLNFSIIISGVIIHLLFAVNYFYNSGLNGPTLLLLVLSFFLLIAVSPAKQYPYWILLNLFIVLSLLTFDYLHPGWVKESYASRFSQFTDVISAYVISILLIYTGTAYIRKNFSLERQSSEEKALALEHANKEKIKLFSIISHDLRSPLTTIQQYLEVLTEKDLTEEERLKVRTHLLRTTKNTQELLLNLLSWSKSQIDGQETILSKTNVYSTLEPTLVSQQQLASKKGITLNYSIAPDLHIQADANRLQLIIRNLVTNAIKFTPATGEIMVKASKKDNEHCLLMVKDNGLGIPYEKQPEIFSLHVKSTYGTSREKGVGLGLVMCKEFAESQNGKIWFESAPGQGTTFYFSIPLCLN
ncbi:sensor histidine kinase [Adhaeribacter aquaticus]|uniref:sensor histidine kinase n=1 Tax=Adhaeribacter aquaticus TaxID=299567 RepID=UPI00040CB930|nr:HAMP domain-containing sensor histidine kinase [Adhaeribacter aquaticus]